MEEQSESIRYNDSMFNENTMLVLLIVHTYMYSSAFELTTTSKKKRRVLDWRFFFRQSEYSLAVIGKNLSLFQRFLDGKQFNFIPVPILDIVHCFEMLVILPYQDFCTIHLQRQQE